MTLDMNGGTTSGPPYSSSFLSSTLHSDASVLAAEAPLLRLLLSTFSSVQSSLLVLLVPLFHFLVDGFPK